MCKTNDGRPIADRDMVAGAEEGEEGGRLMSRRMASDANGIEGGSASMMPDQHIISERMA